MVNAETLAKWIGEANTKMWGMIIHGNEGRRKFIAEYIIEKMNNGGKWVATPDEYGICATEFQCSVCKECFCTSEMDDASFIETMKYCPHCGAKMNKEVFND